MVNARCARAWADDTGSAVVEFLGVALLLLVPTVYLVLVLGRMQAASFAAESAALEAGRSYVTAPTRAEGEAAALASVRLALADQGFDDDAADVLSVACSSSPCRAPGSTVTVTVQVTVDLPLVPGVVRRAVPLSVPVVAGSLAAVDRFAPEEP